MEQVPEVAARINGVTLSHGFFEHLGSKERGEILAEIKNKISHIVSFEFNGKAKCAAIISVTEKGVHVREMGGNFTWSMRHIEKYCQLVADFLGKKYITFRTMSRGIGIIGHRLGFEETHVFNDGSFEFEKRIA